MMPSLPVCRMFAVLLLLGMLGTLSPAIRAATPQLAAGAQHSVALHADGTVYAWGNNSHGQLGNGEAGEGLLSARPVRVRNLTDIVALAARANHTLALRADGTVWAWGQNDRGQLGDGSQVDRPMPLQVNALTGVALISTGRQHSFAVRSDGTLWVWGANDGGRFGNGSAGWGEVSTTPIRVLALSDVIAATAGYGQSFAIKKDGTLWAWGENSDGKLGLGTFTDTETLPTQVVDLRAVTGIATQAVHIMARTGDGQLWAWGSDNGSGQFGDGTTTASALPVTVRRQPNGEPTALALGWAHSVIRLANGQVWTWGNNWYGQLGIGEADHQTLPVQVTALAAAEAIAAGEHHSLAMTADGFVWNWGLGGQGQLGLGDDNLFSETLPRQVLDPDGTGFLNLLQTQPTEAMLTLRIAGSGRVRNDSGAIDCPGVCEAMFATDREIRLSATSESGWTFAGWGGACTGSLDCFLTLNGPTSVIANFTELSNRYQLDSPVNGSFESGIGVVHGWVCEASRISIQVDDHPHFVASYGAARTDSQGTCGDNSNGFAAAINWADYGDGEHTLILFADGQPLTEARVIVTTLGQSFLSGLSANTRVSDFPAAGLSTPLAWSEPHQNFVVSRSTATVSPIMQAANSTGNWESPLAGGIESGQALIRGWTCEAGTVTVSLDGMTLSPPYGSEREDTQTVCGDADNGYALAINWNDYADGMHQMTLNLDGLAVETRTFNIATPAGQGSVSGVQRQHRLTHFPHPGDELRLQWSEPHQNFRLIDYLHASEARDNAWRVTEIYIATLGYAPDDEGMRYWIDNLQNGGWTPTAVAQSFFDQPLVQALYPSTAGYEALIEALYQNLFGRAADAEGRDYWLGELNTGRVSRDQMIIALIEGGWSNPEAMDDMARFGNRVQVGLAFAAAQAERGIRYSALSAVQQTRLRQIGAAVLQSVTDAIDTRAAAIASMTDVFETL
jgi:alpha-tubulin suppressor-like RCC1 family protein